jgi:hypothetical protein
MLASYLQPYHQSLAPEEQAICERLAELITAALPEAEGKIWHAHPVWFLEDNPVVGYSKQKKGIRLMFWSGADFGEALLNVRGGKFKDASVFYSSVEELEPEAVQSCLQKARHIQWDYKNLIKRKGKLEKINP